MSNKIKSNLLSARISLFLSSTTESRNRAYNEAYKTCRYCGDSVLKMGEFIDHPTENLKFLVTHVKYCKDCRSFILKVLELLK